MRTQTDSLERSIKAETSVRWIGRRPWLRLHYNSNKRLKWWEKKKMSMILLLYRLRAPAYFWISDRVHQHIHPVTQRTQETQANRRNSRQLHSPCCRHRFIEFPFAIADAKEIYLYKCATRIVSKCSDVKVSGIERFSLRYQISTPVGRMNWLYWCRYRSPIFYSTVSASLALAQLVPCVCVWALSPPPPHILRVDFSLALPAICLSGRGVSLPSHLHVFVCLLLIYMHVVSGDAGFVCMFVKFSSDKTLRLASPG